MDFVEHHTFAAPFEQVWGMFRDPAAHLAKYEAMGHRDIEVLESTGGDDGFRVVIRRLVDLDLPGFAAKVLKPINTVTTTDVWRRTGEESATGTQEGETAGAPVTIAATTSLRGEGNQTHYEVSVRLDVKVPLIGGRIASWAGSTARDQLKQEFAAGDTWLADQR